MSFVWVRYHQPKNSSGASRGTGSPASLPTRIQVAIVRTLESKMTAYSPNGRASFACLRVAVIESITWQWERSQNEAKMQLIFSAALANLWDGTFEPTTRGRVLKDSLLPGPSSPVEILLGFSQ